VLPVVLFHPITGRWRPACLRAATASVETVSPPFGGFILALLAAGGVRGAWVAARGGQWRERRFLQVGAPESTIAEHGGGARCCGGAGIRNGRKGEDGVPVLKIAVSHQIAQEEALRRMQAYGARLKARYGDKVSDLEESWDGNVLSFSGSGMGQSISGTVTVNAGAVAVELDLPFAAMLMKGKIESTVRSEVSRVLG